MAENVAEKEGKISPQESTVDKATKADDLSFLKLLESGSLGKDDCATLAPITKSRTENELNYSNPRDKDTKEERNAQLDRVTDLLRGLQKHGCVTADDLNLEVTEQANKAMVALAKDVAEANGKIDTDKFNKLFGKLAESINIDKVNKQLRDTNYEMRRDEHEDAGDMPWWHNPTFSLVDKTTNSKVLEYTNPIQPRSF